MRGVLDRCFKGTKEIPPRLLSKRPDIAAAEKHLAKAERNNAAMDLMFESGFLDWAIVCAYYSMYHATMASLWLLGIEARSHECAIAAFESFYVKKKKVSERYLEHLKRAKSLSDRYVDTLKEVKKMRISASYGLGEIRSEEASVAQANAKEFVTAINALISEEEGFGYKRMKKE
jgi:uncharacterized protein (UPF0332 family)